MSLKQDVRTTVHRLFSNVPVTHSAEDQSSWALFPLTDFYPAMDPEEMIRVCEGMHAAVEHINLRSSAGAAVAAPLTAVVGVASRSGGPLAHGVALLLKDLPYSLANWYPAGSQGDIVVEHEGGFSGDGQTFLNGLSRGDRVVFIDDCLRSGKTAGALIAAAIHAGVDVIGAVFAGEIVSCGGRDHLAGRFPSLHVVTLVQVSCDGARSSIVSDSLDDFLPEDRSVNEAAYGASSPLRAATAEAVMSMSPETMAAKFQRTLNAFVGVPIYTAQGSTYPYSNFTLTDFKPLLIPSLVEDMADCSIFLLDQSINGSSTETNPVARVTAIRNALDIVVSEADRGGGPLVLAVAARLRLPFTLANWYSGHTDVGVATQAYVGYSGHGKIYLNGIREGDSCLVVDDMLSSGGTCEALFRGIGTAKGTIRAAIFASEKVNTGGRGRLLKQWASATLLSLCYFISEGATTVAHAPTPTPPGNPTPIQH